LSAHITVSLVDGKFSDADVSELMYYEAVCRATTLL
jgi:hypothetical protein